MSKLKKIKTSFHFCKIYPNWFYVKSECSRKIHEFPHCGRVKSHLPNQTTSCLNTFSANLAYLPSSVTKSAEHFFKCAKRYFRTNLSTGKMTEHASARRLQCRKLTLELKNIVKLDFIQTHFASISDGLWAKLRESRVNVILLFIIFMKREISEWQFSTFSVILSEKMRNFSVISMKSLKFRNLGINGKGRTKRRKMTQKTQNDAKNAKLD